MGDGEIIAQNLVRAVINKKTKDTDLEKIKGITYLDSQNNFKFTGYDHPLPADMIERPDYDILKEIGCSEYYLSGENDQILKLSNLRPDLKFDKTASTATVVVAKGCVARCTFCHRFEKG